MLIKKCDRCGKYFKDIDTDLSGPTASTQANHISMGYLSMGYANTYNVFNEIKCWDLCPNCIEAFDDWVHGRKQFIEVK